MEHFSDITIEKSELLRYLGYGQQQIDDTLDNLLDECRQIALSAFSPRFVYDTFPLVFAEDAVVLGGTSLRLTGQSIKTHLSGCDRCVLLATSVGYEIEKQIRYYTQFDLTKAAILDAAATALLEALCDGLEARIQNAVSGDHLTSRYGVGYGDLPISLQPELLTVLDAQKKIGVTCTDDYTLTPSKSVTSIIGVSKLNISSSQTGCNHCNLSHSCNYRKDGNACGIK